jgi:hypothetical protein
MIFGSAIPTTQRPARGPPPGTPRVGLSASACCGSAATVSAEAISTACAGARSGDHSQNPPLHPGRLLVDQPDRDLVRHHHPQSIRRGTFTSVKVLIKQIRDYIAAWNTDPRPFAWTATADEILLLPWAKHVCGLVGGCRCSLVAPAAQDRQIRLGGSLAAR